MKTIQENDSDFICNINAPCFHTLSEPEINLIKESNTQVSFRKGENLTKQGTYASYILFILKGVGVFGAVHAGVVAHAYALGNEGGAIGVVLTLEAEKKILVVV